MFEFCSNITGHRTSRKQRHGNHIGHRCPKELRILIERSNDQYEVREEAFVRVFWRDRYGIFHNFTISAAHSLSDKEVVALAIREYGVPGRASVVMVEHVMHQFLVLGETEDCR